LEQSIFRSDGSNAGWPLLNGNNTPPGAPPTENGIAAKGLGVERILPKVF